MVDLQCIHLLCMYTYCKLASLTAEVAPVKSPKDHVATRGPGTPKVHHWTQHDVQVVVHLRNTQASSRKELPAALRRRSGHESSADWLTATEQRDKNVAAASSCLFHPSVRFYSVFFCSVLSSLGSVPCSILSSLLFSLLFFLFVLLGSCSLALTLLLLLSVLLFSSPLFSLLVFFETLLSSTSWIVLPPPPPPCLLQESSSCPRVLLRLSSSRRPTYPRAWRRLPIFESIRAACRLRRHIFFTNTCPSGLFSWSPSWLLWFLKYSSAHPSVRRSVACRWWRRRPY